MKNVKTLATALLIGLALSGCAHHGKPCCSPKKCEGKQCEMKKKDCKDGQCPMKKGEHKKEMK